MSSPHWRPHCGARIALPGWALELALPDQDIRILAAIAERDLGDLGCFETQVKMAERLGLPLSVVSAGFRRLLRVRVVYRFRNRDNRVAYKLRPFPFDAAGGGYALVTRGAVAQITSGRMFRIYALVCWDVAMFRDVSAPAVARRVMNAGTSKGRARGVAVPISDKTAARHLADLTAAGWFTVQRAPGKATVYTPQLLGGPAGLGALTEARKERARIHRGEPAAGTPDESETTPEQWAALDAMVEEARQIELELAEAEEAERLDAELEACLHGVDGAAWVEAQEALEEAEPEELGAVIAGLVERLGVAPAAAHNPPQQSDVDNTLEEVNPPQRSDTDPPQRSQQTPPNGQAHKGVVRRTTPKTPMTTLGVDYLQVVRGNDQEPDFADGGSTPGPDGGATEPAPPGGTTAQAETQKRTGTGANTPGDDLGRVRTGHAQDPAGGGVDQAGAGDNPGGRRRTA